MAILFVCCSARPANKPYQATWLQITKTDSGYVVYNYPSLWNDGATKDPEKIVFDGDKLTWITFSDEPTTYQLEGKMEECGGDNYQFKVGNYFRFEWEDKDKHIARWTIYHGDDRVLSEYYYVDSLYNRFPIVDFKWDEDKGDF